MDPEKVLITRIFKILKETSLVKSAMTKTITTMTPIVSVKMRTLLIDLDLIRRTINKTDPRKTYAHFINQNAASTPIHIREKTEKNIRAS